MIKEFAVSGFKKFKDFKIDNLGRINILLGGNNVGKTSLLEAIYTLSCGQNFDPFFSMIVMKHRNSIQESMGISTYDIGERIHTLFNLKDSKVYSFEVSSKDINGKNKIFKHKVEPAAFMSFFNPSIGNYGEVSNQFINLPNGPKVPIINLAKWNIYNKNNEVITNQISMPELNQYEVKDFAYPVKFLDILSHRLKSKNIEIYASLKRNPNLMKEFLTEMKKIFPEVDGIDMIPFKDGVAPVSIIKNNGEILPIYLFGDGLQRWFNTIGEFVISKNSIKLIEEIDATLHFGAQREMGGFLMRLSKEYNNQVFASSHSIEFVDNFLAGIESTDKDLLKEVRIITMKEDDGEILTRVLDGQKALKKRELFDLELR